VLAKTDNCFGIKTKEERNVNEILLRSLGLAASAVIVAFAYSASAQNKKMMPAEKHAACSSLKDEAACKAGNNCNWVLESRGDKVKRKAHCRSNPATKNDSKKK
jgi:hypothetical protein